jgi:hypothetical protein
MQELEQAEQLALVVTYLPLAGMVQTITMVTAEGTAVWAVVDK